MKTPRASSQQHQQNQLQHQQQPQPLPQRPIVVCGPSGSGKSTLLRRLLADHKDKFAFTVSHTTRAPRKGELDGREYHFVSQEEMLNMIRHNELIEHTTFSGNTYGTSKRALCDAMLTGAHLILELDIEGVRALSDIPDLQPVFIFIRPPSKQMLLERLMSRGSESIKSLRSRLERADEELMFVERGYINFDLVLINDDLEETYRNLKHFLALA